MVDRREFLTTTTAATLAATLPRVPWRPGGREAPAGHPRAGAPGVTTLRDPRIKALALTALDAARSAGAHYADVRLTYSREWRISANLNQTEELGLAVRALVNGYWGWAATPYLAASEAPRVAQSAVALAQLGAATGQMRPVELGTVPVVAEGTWTTPIRQDPLAITPPEMLDWVSGTMNCIQNISESRGVNSQGMFPPPYDVGVTFTQQERVFASTEGSYLMQTVYVTDPQVAFVYHGRGTLLPIQPAQQGYEIMTDTPWEALIRQAMDHIDEQLKHPLPVKPLEIGRYDVLFSAQAMAALVAQTLGMAAQVDRAVGYEANAGGTSYLGPDPLTLLGTPVASPLVTLTADRTAPKALATIGWDDEGVVPAAFPLVKEGVLVDYQTTREQAAWLAPWYTKQGRPVRSHGCAAAPDALAPMLQHTPNLTLEPGKEALGLEELIASLDAGVLVELPPVEGMRLRMDYQASTGFANPWGRYSGTITEVRRGKRVGRYSGSGMQFMFRSSELWKNVLALGGPKSLESLYRFRSSKGEPEQEVAFSVSAVPALIKQVAVIDSVRQL